MSSDPGLDECIFNSSHGTSSAQPSAFRSNNLGGVNVRIVIGIFHASISRIHRTD